MLAQLLPILMLHSLRGRDDATGWFRLSLRPPNLVETLAVRVSSPAGVLWQGNLRVSQNQGASYSQNLSHASPTVCPPNSPYDRSERSSLSFNVYSQNSGDYGSVYRIDASWGRPLVRPAAAIGGRGRSRSIRLSGWTRAKPVSSKATRACASR